VQGGSGRARRHGCTLVRLELHTLVRQRSVRGLERPRLRRYRPLFIDDLDGNAAEGTVRFGLDGTEYEIDLNARHAQELRDALARYVGAARRAGGAARRCADDRSAGARPAGDREVLAAGGRLPGQDRP
jgi:Lsr2